MSLRCIKIASLFLAFVSTLLAQYITASLNGNVPVNQQATQNLTLKVVQVSERIPVEADAELVDTRTGMVGQLVDQEKVIELPPNGRLGQRLAFLAAGTGDPDPNATSSTVSAITTRI